MTTEAVALAGGIWRLLLARRAGVEVLLMPLEPQYVAGVGAGAGCQRRGGWPVDDRPFHVRHDS